MSPFAATILPFILAGAAGSVEWLDETRISVTATVEVRDPARALDKGSAELQKRANEACRKIGKAVPEGQTTQTLTGVGLSRDKVRSVTLRGTFACVAG